MLPKSKIRLSRSLRAQTTPYPEVSRWIKRGLFVLSFILAAGIYMAAKPHQATTTDNQPKQILGEQKRQAEYLDHIVKRGETLFNISQTYGLSWQTLAEINELREPYTLRLGQKLKIPQK